jgi:hypothetical protein
MLPQMLLPKMLCLLQTPSGLQMQNNSSTGSRSSRQLAARVKHMAQ